jgi:hypothetical protein
VIPEIGNSIGNHHSAAEDLLVLDQDKEEAAIVLPKVLGIRSGNINFIVIQRNGQKTDTSLRDTSTDATTTRVADYR